MKGQKRKKTRKEKKEKKRINFENELFSFLFPLLFVSRNKGSLRNVNVVVTLLLGGANPTTFQIDLAMKEISIAKNVCSFLSPFGFFVSFFLFFHFSFSLGFLVSFTFFTFFSRVFPFRLLERVSLTTFQIDLA